jgi:hypothetical protein
VQLIKVNDWSEVPAEPQVLVIDDFFEDLSWLIPHLKTQTRLTPQFYNYGGKAYFPPPEIKAYALERISRALNLELDESDTKKTGELRVSYKESEFEKKTFVHADPSMNALVYLSGIEGDEGGTSFYRHKEVGFNFLHSTDPEIKKHNLICRYDTNDVSRWNVVKTIPFKKNRALIFNGHYMHAVPTRYYGESFETGRITQNFFFNKLKDYFWTNS